MLTRQWIVAMGLAFLTSACGVNTIVHDIDEKQANDIIVLLADNQVSASKGITDNGRKIVYSIAVPAKDRLDSLRILKDHDFPQRVLRGYAAVFSEGGLIPTSAEEKAKKLSAMEGEIEMQLRLINGVLDVEANIVMPDESALRTTDDATTPTTASVTVKYLPGKGGSKPLAEPQIQAVVAAAVEKLTPDHVVVVMTPGGRFSYEEERCPECAAGRGVFGHLSAKQQNMVIAGVLLLVLILGLGLIFGQVRLRTVRSRLLRLQNEIAKARRKPDLPAPQ